MDTETTGHGMIFGLTLGKVNQAYISLKNSTHGSPLTELLCFGLEVRTSTIEEAQNKEETLQSENVQCVKFDTPTSDNQKTWKCVKTADSAVKRRIKKLVTCDKTFRKAMIELGRSEKIIIEMDQLASEKHTHDATRAEIDVYRGNWWIRSNVVNFDTMPTRHQPDFKKALSTMYRLKKAEEEKQYAKFSQNSSSWWQWQTNWWESDYEKLTTKMG